MLKHTIIYTCFALFLSMPLTGCGVKPAHVDPPQGAEDTVFPRTYPDPTTDPAPGGPAPF